jgi:hypothetical protein
MPLLRDAIREAFDDLAVTLRKSPDTTGGLSTRTNRSFIHDRIAHRLFLAEVSGNHPGLRVRTVRGLKVVIIGDRLLLKLKRLDPRFRSRNIQTEQTRAFDNQVPLPVAGGDALSHATGGYVLDPAGAEPMHVVVTCWSGRQNLWTLDLDKETAAPLIEFTAITPPKERIPAEHAQVRGTGETAKPAIPVAPSE